MRKILLVDDEILVRVGIKSILNWEEYGYTIIGEACNGKEALEKVRENQPDIVLTDLVMDTMNGFDLIKALRIEFPSVKIVVLSCYNDFENVREAMKLGAKDYIFKLTIKPDELLKALSSLEEQQDIKSVRPEESNKNERIIYKNINAIKCKLIKTAVEKSYLSQDTFLKEFYELGSRVVFTEPYVLMYFSIDEFYRLNINSLIKEKELLKFSMLNIMEEVLQKYKKVEVFDYENGDIIALVNDSDDVKVESTLKETFETINEYVKRYLGVNISAGISNTHQGVNMIQAAASDALLALKLRFFQGGSTAYFSSRGMNSNDNLPMSSEFNISVFSDLVEHLEVKGIGKYIDDYIRYLQQLEGLAIHKARSLLLECLYPFINTAKKRGIDLDELKDDCGFTPYEVITRYDTLVDMKRWFEGFIEQFAVACRSKTDSVCREEIVRIKEFVRNNLQKEINIKNAANCVNMSESYFSHLFKKETGISFVDYVNTARIDRAKELILQTDLKVYEIAERVGFDNANYFSMLFKKMTGFSPNDYRQK